MVMNCPLNVADLLLYCQEREFVNYFNHDNQAYAIKAFSSTFKYLFDILNIDNPHFEGMFNHLST